MFSDGFRPCPGWLATCLRNRFASGDMVTVETRSMPSIRRGKDTYPLIKCSAMRDGQRWSVFVLSRKLNAEYNALGETPRVDLLIDSHGGDCLVDLAVHDLLAKRPLWGLNAPDGNIHKRLTINASGERV